MLFTFPKKNILPIVNHFVTLQCQNKRSKTAAPNKKFMQPLGVTKISLKGNKQPPSKTPL